MKMLCILFTFGPLIHQTWALRKFSQELVAQQFGSWSHLHPTTVVMQFHFHECKTKELKVDFWPSAFLRFQEFQQQQDMNQYLTKKIIDHCLQTDENRMAAKCAHQVPFFYEISKLWSAFVYLWTSCDPLSYKICSSICDWRSEIISHTIHCIPIPRHQR